MQPPPKPLLILYSHGRQPPLDPPPDLKYDLRSIPNPPKALRDVSDGRSKRLREHLLSEEKFVARLEQVEADVRKGVAEKVEGLGEGEGEGRRRSHDGETESGGIDVVVEEGSGEEEGAGDTGDVEEEESRSIVFRVGCNCALGHHRSVAFVTELAARPWPKDWEVQVVHRDLEKKRTGGSRSKQKSAWKGKRREHVMSVADEWHT
ncbi:hypothetical protein BU24DRAFT_450561 [Aaosphaeria arxii CBS 175.79]|uniref:RapZ C-terminal domain-containing protein n=1 Tax=Aaosphaeria arxii CBS 175.79 TaxID=1450172 RepID=A0A6A5XT85_9PLEO|nr:uncharacterized protein BU24DRAFT_450561 [Aaosphaeria arxii CBS 175.79]KAF2015931.1 hypothetical protein BU24DRAFT_450561 [Aaosphaeria arxii CBS 175.79]